MPAPLPEDLVRAIGRSLDRMAQRTRDEPAYLPHPIAVAVAEAVRGGNLTDGDGTFGAQEGPYLVRMSKAHGHFALLDVANAATGKVLPAEAVLRLLAAWDHLADHPGEAVRAEVAEGLVAGFLGIDDGTSGLLLRKAGLAGPMVPKAGLLALVEDLPA